MLRFPIDIPQLEKWVLPDGGAVDALKMVIGDRVVVGNIKERQQARAIYEQAKQNGQKAALTEQERPNIFTNSVVNIGPGETVLVQIEYQEPVHQSGDQFSLRIPMVVGPRYNPAPLVQSVDLRAGDNGWGAAANDPFRTAIASRRRSSTRATTRRSIPQRSASICRRDFRSAMSRATSTTSRSTVQTARRA